MVQQETDSCGKKQRKVELRLMAHETCEGLWLKLLLAELEVPLQRPLEVFCDNKVAISISHNPVHHGRTKYVEVDSHFIKEKIEGVIKITYVPIAEQTANLLTKVSLGQPMRSY